MADKRFASTVSVVFHNGACSDTTNSDVHYMMSNNFDYSSVLLRRCMDQGTRIIYASSASVYGMSRESWFNEEDNMMPANTYAKTKALFDDYASMFFEYLQPDCWSSLFQCVWQKRVPQRKDGISYL